MYKNNNKLCDIEDAFNDYEKMLNESIEIGGETDDYYCKYKIRCLERWIAKFDSNITILDFGCGIGKLTALMAQKFIRSKVIGYDISIKAINIARKRFNNIDNLIFTNEIVNEKYDIIVVANVFHHIKSQDHQIIFYDLANILNKKGRIVIFEHNPLNPLTRYAVKSCPFDGGVKLISLRKLARTAYRCRLNIHLRRYIVFFPRILKFFRNIEFSLGFIPLGAQYMLSLRSE